MVISSSQNSLKQLLHTSMHNTFLVFGKNIKEKKRDLVVSTDLFIYLFVPSAILRDSCNKKGTL